MSSLGITPELLDRLDKVFPGLIGALERLDKQEIGREEFLRLVLIALKDTNELYDGLNKLTNELRDAIKNFIAGKSIKEVSQGLRLPLSSAAQQHAPPVIESEVPIGAQKLRIYEEDGSPVKVVVDLDFTNWSGTVTNSPKFTCFPTTVAGLQSIVKLAAESQKRVRVAGFRETWSNLYSEDSEILVSLIELSVAVSSSAVIHENAVNAPPTDFNQIKLDSEDVPGSDGKKRYARIGAGVTNEAFRIWSMNNGWTLGSNVIPVENTFGGANAPICHGSGLHNMAPNDAVREVKYVDAHGEAQCITNPDHIKAAAGAFGLFGIITEFTYELDKMTYANLSPLKLNIQLAIPPPDGFDVPKGIEGNFTKEQLEEAETEFVKKASSYYSEWFWFPYRSQIWVNCWDNTPDATDVVENPDQASTFRQWLQNLADAWLNSAPAFKELPGRDQAIINGTMNIHRSPPSADDTGIARTHLINAIHYRRGTFNYPILDTEFSIPIPALATDPTQPDWSFVRRAWWDAISLTYDDEYKTGAARVGIEMRILSHSDIIMAPQQGNVFGTASIEIVSTQPAGEEGVWRPFVQRIVDAWSAYEVGGQFLNVRPHWAKEWEDLTVRGVEIKQHLKDSCYNVEIPSFLSVLADIGDEHGWTLEDINQRFSNPLLDSLFFS